MQNDLLNSPKDTKNTTTNSNAATWNKNLTSIVQNQQSLCGPDKVAPVPTANNAQRSVNKPNDCNCGGSKPAVSVSTPVQRALDYKNRAIHVNK